MSRSLDTLLRPSLLAMAIALSAPLASTSLIAAEQASSVRAYNLPAAPLATTLNQIASQGGLALTREWATSLLADGIRVNAVIPAKVRRPSNRFISMTGVLPVAINTIIRLAPTHDPRSRKNQKTCQCANNHGNPPSGERRLYLSTKTLNQRQCRGV